MGSPNTFLNHAPRMPPPCVWYVPGGRRYPDGADRRPAFSRAGVWGRQPPGPGGVWGGGSPPSKSYVKTRFGGVWGGFAPPARAMSKHEFFMSRYLENN